MNIIILLIIVSSTSLTKGSPAVVELPLGKVEGNIKNSVNVNKFYSFEGIPYAKPPVGENRFEEPKPLEPWNNTWVAKTIHKCLQFRHQPESSKEDPVTGSEDCLYLNIYTPTLDERANLDVIIFIHGGAFMFNYGAFQGFLSTEDDVVPGNNGLKDQIAAFKFVRDYIVYFGGNPNSVTITGNSAGGASVHFHYLIRRSIGLFHKGFSQSGTSLNPWVLMEEPLKKDKENCYINRPWLYNPFSPFGVVVDAWANDPLLPDHPYQLLKKKLVYDVPWIASHVNSEGLYPAAEFYSNDDYLKDIDKRWNKILPHLLHYNETVENKNLNTVSKKIREYYFGNKSVNKETFDNLVQVCISIIGDRDIK
ncbi:hypothetical protein NQ314_005765 [Rhamnusium bicolor]|uniref:Carboxylic ester hydrolase n=1 Tax=Rhamnusium bicolor TaxID=1586634 RepID=A0AAV8ZF22_9CUCU|nr:hypothetical protein NQ314_005765 [Rhamnusium bicolor]